MFGKTAVLKVFFGVPFNQFELSSLPPITILEIDSAPNVSCEWLKFLGRPVSILKKDSTIDVLLEGFQTFLE